MKLPEPLSHAYLVTGGSEKSRAELAVRMAQAYLCDGQSVPCGYCRHCRKVETASHPDLVWVTPEEGKKEIGVDQIRTLRSDAYIRPNEGKRKVYVIDPADSMNQWAQNAVLKVLEEGPQYAAFLLLAGEPGRILETVRSRCELLALQPEDRSPDPELLVRAGNLADIFLCGSELEAAETMAAIEQEKMKSGQLAQLLLLVEHCVSERIAEQPGRAVKILRLLKACRDNYVYNPGPGHTLGWLTAELFRT